MTLIPVTFPVGVDVGSRHNYGGLARDVGTLQSDSYLPVFQILDTLTLEDGSNTLSLNVGDKLAVLQCICM
jgi:hypothetical protein